MQKFNRDEFLKTRNKLRKWGWGLLFISIPVILDIPFPPIPPQINIILGLLTGGFACWFLYGGYSLAPMMKKVPYIAAQKANNGLLTIPILSMELDISREEAKTILEILEQEGYVKLVKYGETLSENVYHYGGTSINKEESKQLQAGSSMDIDAIIARSDAIRRENEEFLEDDDSKN